MPISTTTFAERMSRIEGGKTTSWTVPGEGLAEYRDERRFLRKAGHRATKRTGERSGFRPVLAISAIVSGAASVILARWLDFTFLDDVMIMAEEQGINATSILSGVPTALALSVILSLFLMFFLGLRGKLAIYLQTAGFAGALFFEADLVALAPEIYAMFYPPSWIAEMMASASLLT